MGDKCGRQVWKTSVGDKCKFMRSQTSRVGDKCGSQVEDKCKLMRPKAPRVCRDKWETSVKSCGPRHPEWETSVGDKCGDKCENHAAQGTQSGRQVWETSGRQV